jgi:hypothetical protein
VSCYFLLSNPTLCFSTPHADIIIIIICLSRDSLSRCGSCTDIPGCRFCLTTFKCVEGVGVVDSDDESLCHEWALEPSSCPELNSCGYSSCDTCTYREGCSWCGALDRCMDDSDTNFVDCQGKIRHGETCPYPFASNTEVDGNLIVRGADDIGGGVLHVSGPCNSNDCNAHGFHSLVLDGGKFEVESGGDVIVSAANTDRPNTPASEVILRAGSGTNKAGGSGGDFFAFAGDAAGGKIPNRFHFSRVLLLFQF